MFAKLDTPWLRHYVGLQDPADIVHFATCLREQDREDIAKLLNCVPENRELNLEALKVTLGIASAGR
jgi:hypothetical protein